MLCHFLPEEGGEIQAGRPFGFATPLWQRCESRSSFGSEGLEASQQKRPVGSNGKSRLFKTGGEKVEKRSQQHRNLSFHVSLISMKHTGRKKRDRYSSGRNSCWFNSQISSSLAFSSR